MYSNNTAIKEGGVYSLSLTTSSKVQLIRFSHIHSTEYV